MWLACTRSVVQRLRHALYANSLRWTRRRRGEWLYCWRARSRSEPGGSAACVQRRAAAFAIGALALRAAWSWGAFLIGWFVLSSVLSRIGRARKTERTRRIVEKGDQRDAWQVLANGGVFALAALGAVVNSAADPVLGATLGEELRVYAPSMQTTLATLAAGALVPTGANTWATEVGTLWGGTPWSLREGGRVPAGTSGAVSVVGTGGMLLGAVLLTALAVATGLIAVDHAWPVAIGGVGGACVDTIIGAWIRSDGSARMRVCNGACHSRLWHSDGARGRHHTT